MTEPIITPSISKEDMVSLENELKITGIVTRTQYGRSVYDFLLKDRSNGLIENMDFSSKISGIIQEEFEQIFGNLDIRDLYERHILLNLGIPSSYHAEHRGFSMKGQIEIVRFDRIERYSPGAYRDEESGPFTFVDIKTHGPTKGPNHLGYTNYDLNLLFGPEKYDELKEYFSARGKHTNLHVMNGPQRLDRAPLKVRKFELKNK